MSNGCKPNLSPIQRELLKHLKIGMNRDELVLALERARTTIYQNLHKLEKIGLIYNFPRHTGKRGRPRILWKRTPRRESK